MATKKYSSYAEIENELEILKLEKEIHYQKIIFSFQKAIENLKPKNAIAAVFGAYYKGNTNLYRIVFNLALPIILKKTVPFLKKWFSSKQREV